MEAENLIKTARALLPAKPGRPRNTDLRRAVSTAYYALFHCLARSCADTLIGKSSTVRGTDGWEREVSGSRYSRAPAGCPRLHGRSASFFGG